MSPNVHNKDFDRSLKYLLARFNRDYLTTSSPDLIKTLLNESSHVKQAVAFETTSPQVLAALALDPDVSVQAEVAHNLFTPSEILNLLGKNEAVRVQEEVASHSKTLLESLILLSRDDSPRLRARVLSNPNITEDILSEFANDNSEIVRAAVAKNPKTPTAVLEKLSKDTHSDVVEALITNEKVPLNILPNLAKYSFESVKYKLAESTKTPTEVLKILCFDNNDLVRMRVASNVSINQETLNILSKDHSGGIIAAVIKNKVTPVEMLRTFANRFGNVKFYKECIISNPNTPSDVLEKLFEYSSYICDRLAEHPNSTESIFQNIYGYSSSFEFKHTLISNKNFPSSLITLLLNDLSPFLMPYQENIIKEKIASHPNTPTRILIKFLKDPNEEIRDLAKKNPNLPKEMKSLIGLFRSED